ncbi:hypothetical protein QZH41_019732, partial [Actinostola sp. cb2023]
MSKVCMAAVNENDKTFSTKRLQERFPEIPETVIAKILTQKTDVDHLEEETQVLREEIDQMSHEIDSIKCSNYK